MKQFFLLIFLFTGVNGFSQAKKAQASQIVRCDIGAFMVMGLQESAVEDATAADSTAADDSTSEGSSSKKSISSFTGQRQLVINSNFPFNIVVDEKYSGPTFSYAMSNFRPEEEGHGPSTSQLSGIRKLRYFKMIEEYKKITLLYTIAPY